MFRWISGIIDRLLVVAGALIFSQAPQYFSQYMHRLAGHAEELRIHIKSIQLAASKNGMELPEYLHKFTSHQDPAISMHGSMMEGMFSRYAELSRASLALQESTPFTRPFVFLEHLNFDIAKATFMSFQPGVLLTVEGAVYALVGMGVGYSVFSILCFLISAPFKKRIVKKI